jgi:zinc finger protein
MECPSCGAELRVVTELYNTPHFGDVFISSVSCDCGFRHSDSFVVNVNEPVRYTIEINSNNIFAKVIRSSSGTIRVPEIGVMMEPGVASQGFITNIEGILFRFEEMVKVAKNWNYEDEEKTKKCDWILKKIRNTLEGNEKLTLIIEDPLGNSLIESKEAVKETLNEKEASKLKKSITILSEEDL